MMLKLFKRTAETTAKLPFAIAWDFISLGNMGEGTSTGKVLRKHQAKKQMDDLIEIAKAIRDLQR